MVGAPEVQAVIFLAQSSEPTIPQPLRAILLMALLGIALLGMILIVGIMLGANWVRRLGKFRRGPPVPTDVKPLRSSASKPDDVARPKVLPETGEDTVSSHDNPTHDTNISP